MLLDVLPQVLDYLSLIEWSRLLSSRSDMKNWINEDFWRLQVNRQFKTYIPITSWKYTYHGEILVLVTKYEMKMNEFGQLFVGKYTNPYDPIDYLTPYPLFDLPNKYDQIKWIIRFQLMEREFIDFFGRVDHLIDLELQPYSIDDDLLSLIKVFINRIQVWQFQNGPRPELAQLFQFYSQITTYDLVKAHYQKIISISRFCLAPYQIQDNQLAGVYS